MIKLNIQLFASTYDVVMRQYNGTDWDTLRPQTVSDNVDDSGSSTKKFLTAQQRTNLIALHDGSNVFLGLYKNNPAFTGDLTTTNLKIKANFMGIALSGGTTFGGLKGTNGVDNVIYMQNETGSLTLMEWDFETNEVLSKGITYYNDVNIVGAKQLVTKEYVDTVAVNIRPTTEVKAISTTNVVIANVITQLDGYTLVNNDRVLLKDQTTVTENGLYTWNSTTQKLTKITPAGNDNVNGSLVFVANGNTNKNDRWYCVSYTLGTWILFDSNIEMIQGSGISISGTTISIATGGVTNAMLAGSIANSKLLLTPVGALEYGTGNNIQVKALGVTNDMLAGSIAYNKLVDTAIFDTLTGWTDPSFGTAGIGQSLTIWLQSALSAIKLLRGTAGYKTDNTQTIADAYSKIATLSGLAGGAVTLKNKISHGTTLPTSNMVTGDLFFLHA